MSHRGQKRSPGAARADTKSGFNVLASKAGPRDWHGQIRGALRWLTRHAREIRRARRAAGKGRLYLDFRYDLKHTGNGAWLHLPLTLVRRAAALGVALEVSVYLVTRYQT